METLTASNISASTHQKDICRFETQSFEGNTKTNSMD